MQMQHEHDPMMCPVNATLDLLNQRWNLRIVRSLLGGKMRFNELSRANGINPRTLRERLRKLEEQGVISRTVVSTMPPNVEYALTDKGMALNGIFEALANWGREWMAPPGIEHSAQAEGLPEPLRKH
jgi:DNA-binding HxlR family transcriptional regulator